MQRLLSGDCHTFLTVFICFSVELAWRSGCAMDCHATTQGSIFGEDGVKTELHVLRKGQ